MRIGIPPSEGPRHRPLTLGEIGENARLIEGAGLDGVWKGHHPPAPGDGILNLIDRNSANGDRASSRERLEDLRALSPADDRDYRRWV